MSEYKQPQPDIQGWMAMEELQWLNEQAARMSSIVEVGAWRGKTTHALCLGCKGQVISVDHFMGSPNERSSTHHEATEKDISQDWWANVGHFKNVSVLKMDSHVAASFFKPRSVDMVFIDACHQFADVLRDLESWLPVARVMIAGHDWGGEVTQAIERMNIVAARPIATLWCYEIP